MNTGVAWGIILFFLGTLLLMVAWIGLKIIGPESGSDIVNIDLSGVEEVESVQPNEET